MSADLAVLAAWLHDIGKFAQRAGAPASQGLEQDLLPGGATHRHVLYTDYFVEKTLPLPPALEPLRGRLARLAAAHHRPSADDSWELAIRDADWLSSGLDRSSGDAEGDYKRARLESIFGHVDLTGKIGQAASSPLRYALRPLDAPDAAFPEQEAGQGPGYADLWSAFCADLARLPLDRGQRLWQATLVSLLERYTWCIPSSTYMSRADISLYDHAATTAALTQAILGADSGTFLLVGGDLSGIQPFIFGRGERADKGASRMLRARSFLLQAVTRSVWLTMLERLGLDPAARIMDAGGRFVLLLPAGPKVRATLEELQDELEAWLLGEFQGDLRLNLAMLELERADLTRQGFCDSFEAFNDALEKAKLQPFARAFAAGLGALLPLDQDLYAANGECVYCHSRPGEKKDEDDQPVCGLCAGLIRLGARLPDCVYIVYTRGSLTGDAVWLPLFGGLKVGLYGAELPAAVAREALDLLSVRGQLLGSVTPFAGHMPRVSREDVERWQREQRLRQGQSGSLFAGEGYEPGQPKTFAMLAEEARIAPDEPDQPWRGIACLGICKADVDNLGLIFSIGFGSGRESGFTLSRFAMLARMLNFFFAAHLVRVIEREYSDIYVVFAGGDDLFVIGPWDRCVSFALRMRRDFARFCGDNPSVTISAGLPLVKASLPMRGMREEAENALEASKHLPGKNASTLFGVSASWPDFEAQLALGARLERLCLEKRISRGFLRRLLGYSRQCAEFMRGKLAKNGLYQSHLAYDLARNWPRERSGECKYQEDLNWLRQFANDPATFSRANMAISWAIYRTRI